MVESDEIATKYDIMINCESLDQVKEFTYLGK